MNIITIFAWEIFVNSFYFIKKKTSPVNGGQRLFKGCRKYNHGFVKRENHIVPTFLEGRRLALS